MKSKSRLPLLLNLLYKETDAAHYETTVTLLKYLEKNDVSVDRKTLQDDMELLQKLGIGIKKIKSSPNKYYWDERVFSQTELQMLIDIVLSSKSISEAKSRELVKKIMLLASRHNAEQLRREIRYVDRPRTDNAEVYRTVNFITEAVHDKRCISFKYTEYNEKKEKVYRNNGQYYHMSPYKLLFNEDFYYVIGYDEKHNGIITFRVDRMEKCKFNRDRYVKKPKDFDSCDYTTKYFKMYDGEEVQVRLEVRNDLMKYIIDKFGLDVETRINTKETFIAKPVVKLSPVFYAWVFQFGGGIKIVGPEQAVEEYRAMKEK